VTAPVQVWDMRASFEATHGQAQRLKETLEIAAAVYFAPTEENASALFRMGAEALVRVGELRRAARADTQETP
jgi:hypothetical protein